MSTYFQVTPSGDRDKVHRGINVAYSAVNPDSPIARGWDLAGPVLVPTDRADIAHAIGKTELRRAYAMGIVSASTGLPADVHQTETGLWSDITHPADYLVRWIETGLRWADGKRAAGAGAVDPDAVADYDAAHLAALDQYAAELVTCAPTWYVDWLARLIHVPKWQHLVEIGAHEWLDGPAPADPGTDWSAKMGRQWQARHKSDAIVSRVADAIGDF